MKKLMSIFISLWVLFVGVSSAASISQEHVYPFSVFDLPVLRDIYQFNSLLIEFPYVFGQIHTLLLQENHGSAVPESLYILDSEKIVSYLDTSSSFEEFYRQLRIDIIRYLLDTNSTDFFVRPYDWQVNSAIIVESWAFKVLDPIESDDGLDILLSKKLDDFASNFTSLKWYLSSLEFTSLQISSEEISQLGSLYLFKNEQDLKDLWYELVSWKSRINQDVDYRRHNIMAAFHNIGTIRLLMPGEVFSTLKEIHYNPNSGRWYEYVKWLVTVGDGAIMLYGWWLCGVATALYQWALTNLGLSVIDYSPHSTYYRNLYEAEVNGTMIKDPWLDATIFSPVYDLKLKNIREYPIIIGFSFDGLSGSQEQVFTLAKSQDKWSFEFIRSYKKWTYSCFTWKINGENRTNCYKHVKNY